MKLNKIFLGLIGMAAFTLASCSSDDKYDWATVSGPQVFFSDQNPTQYEIDPEGASFNVPISRVDDSSALTVNLTSTTANPMYSVPASVTFNAGQKEAYIPVSYDATKIEYGRYDDITITIADASNGTAWGVQEFTFKAGVTDWGPWQKWNSAGTATYTYVNLWSGEDPNLPFVYRHNLIKPNLYQFKLSKWGYGVEIVFDYDEETGYVTCAKQWTGYDHSSYGYVYAEDYNAYRVEKGANPIAAGYGTFDKEQGIITIPLAYVVSAGSFGYDPEYIYIDGYVRADYSLSTAWSGIFTDATGSAYAVINTTAGADVAEVSSVVIDAAADDAAVADAIAAGDLEAFVSAPGTINVPIAEDQTGKLQVVSAVVVDGELKSYAAAPFEYYGGKNPWKTLGQGYFVDDMILPLFGYDPDTYPVTIDESTETPGLYRLKAMYSAVAADFGVESGTGDVLVHAEAADGVYIPLQPLELTLGNNGPFSISTDAGELVTEYGYETVKAQEPTIFGSVKNGVISFPVLEEENSKGEKVQYQAWLVLGGKHYFGGTNGAFQIFLPGSTAAARAKSAARAAKFARSLSTGKFMPVKSSDKKLKKAVLVSDSRMAK